MDKDKKELVDDILNRGVVNIIPSKAELKKLLLSGKKLNVYLGIDPTSTKIHLGNATHLRKLQKFVELGHNVTFLIGDFTTLIGDTSDKNAERPILTYEQIQTNFASYQKQAEKFIDFNRVRLVHNSHWLKQLAFTDIVKLCQNFSVGDFISRELIRKRLDSGKRVRLDETLYPIMQGYDSYHLDTDIQIGGTDQTFNMQAGRTLQKNLRGKQSFIITSEFLLGTDGRKMSKSWNNGIFIEDSPKDIYGKVMSIKDDLIIPYFTLATNLSLKAVKQIEFDIDSGQLEPMAAKKQLAQTITSELHSIKDSKKAQKEFETVFQNRGVPQKIPSLTLTKPTPIIDILSQAKITTSNSQSKRLITQGGVRVDNQKVTDPNQLINPQEKPLIKIGKLKFLQIKPNQT